MQTFAFAPIFFFLGTERASGLSEKLMGMSWKQSPLKDSPEPLTRTLGLFSFLGGFYWPADLL